MTTSGNTKRKIRAVVMRSRRYFGCQDKSLFDTYGGVFLQSKVSDIIFNRPIRFDIRGIFERLPTLIQFSFRVFSLGFLFLKSFIADRMRSRLNQPCINGHTFVYGQFFGGKLQKHFRIDFGHGMFRKSGAKATEGGMIRRRLIKGNIKGLFERYPIIDLCFQLGIGFNMEPLQNQETLEQKQRRISGSTLDIFSRQYNVSGADFR